MQRDKPILKRHASEMLIHEKKRRRRKRGKKNNQKKRLSIEALCGHIKHFKPNIFLFSPAKFSREFCVRLLYSTFFRRLAVAQLDVRACVIQASDLSAITHFRIKFATEKTRGESVSLCMILGMAHS